MEHGPSKGRGTPGRRAAFLALSAVGSLALHLLSFLILQELWPALLHSSSGVLCGNISYGFRLDNPFFPPEAPPADGEEPSPSIVLRLRRRNPWRDVTSDELPTWDPALLPLSEILGKPFEPEKAPKHYEEGPVDETWERPWGDSMEFISSSPFRGRGTFDTSNISIGGGGRYGGTPARGKDAVHLALGWLIRHQGPDGSWSARNFSSRCRKNPAGRCVPSVGRGDFDAGVTGLATLAFLGAGYTPQSADAWDGIRFSDTIQKALVWMSGHQDPEGRVGPRNAPLLNHCLAALALCEASRAGPFRNEASKAVEYAAAAVKAGGGWRSPGEGPGDDPWQIGWAVLLMRSAVSSNVPLPPGTSPAADRWTEDAADTSLLLRPKLWCGNGSGFHRGYFTAQALVSYDGEGGMLWRGMMARIREVVEPGQNRDGTSCREGSWEPADLSEREGGPVYATALRALMLELCSPYGYTPGGGPD